MEDSRKLDDHNWDDIRKFIEESRIYRAQDEITQKHQLSEIDTIKGQVKFQNGRTFELEKWREQIQATIREKKDAKEKYYKFLSVCATVVSAITAIIMIFKK